MFFGSYALGLVISVVIVLTALDKKESKSMESKNTAQPSGAEGGEA